MCIRERCGRAIEKQTIDQMVDAVMKLPERTRIQILAPVVRGRKGEHQKLFEKAKKSGYVRVIVDGNMYELSEEIPMDKNIKHNIDIVVDLSLIHILRRDSRFWLVPSRLRLPS